MNSKRDYFLFLAGFLAPALFLFTIFVAWPSVRALIYSVQKWNGLTEPEWVGLANFRQLFADDLFIRALEHNIILLVGAGSIIIILSLAFAAMLHQRLPGSAVFRITFFFPNVIAAVAIAILWIVLYSTTAFGVFNAVLMGLQDLLGYAGLSFMEGMLPYPFLDSTRLIYSLIPMMVWTATGFYMVLFLAAMENIPPSYYEAARLDGATGIQQFFHVTLPMIREVLVVGVVFLVISSFKFFDAVWVMENQVPAKDSHVLATVLYQKVFSEYNVGYAAAVAVLLFLIVLSATLITLRWSRKEAVEY